MGGATTFPRVPEDLATDWLSDRVGGTISSFEVEQIGIGVGILGRLYRLTLSGDNVPASVIAKFPTLDEGARMNVVEPLRFYEKEVNFYKQDPDTIPVATPEVFAAEFDPATGDFVLLLEDCGGRRMEDQITGCATGDAEAAIDALVDLHASSWNGSRFADLPWLPSYSDPPFPQVIAGMYKQAWPRALEVVGDRMPPHIRDFGERYEGIVQWFMDELSHEPLTFCHGDFRLDNLFFGTKPEHAPVTVVDWQICFRGRGGYDVAYFISQSLTAEARRACEDGLLDRYVQGLAARGIDYPRDELVKDYKRTTAYCFIYPIVSAGQIEVTNERMRELINGILDRAVVAIEDAGALEVLPN
jgi:aminoglycoside phosphotransferase (APT) family kinase protein